MKIFGFSFGFRNKEVPASPNDVIKGQQQPVDLVLTAAGGNIHHSAAVGLVFEEDKKQIELYRTLSTDAYIRDCISDIVNEAIDQDEVSGKMISLDLRNAKSLSDSIKNIIEEEFNTILNLMKFNQNGEEYFKDWLVDGRQFFYLIPHANTKMGFKEIRKIDSRYIKRVLKLEHDPARTTTENLFNPKSKIVYLYSRPTDEELSRNNSISTSFMTSYVKTSNDSLFEITQDAIAYSDSGEKSIYDQVISVLHHAIKPFNQLSMMEDSTIIYAMARAPERRIWYIGVGDLNPNQAKSYIQDLMRQYNSSEIYNSDTGTVSNQYVVRSVLEDIWIPRGAQDSKNTEVDTLESGKALQDKMETVDWYKKKLYKSLGIPESRLNSEASYQFGRSAEITRDEVKFAKYINVLRRKFSEAILDILKKQLVLRKIVTEAEWDEVKKNAEIKWHGVSYFREMKSLELWDARLNMFDRMSGLVGTYVGKDFIYDNVLKMSPAEVAEQKKKIKQDEAEGELVPAASGAIGNDQMNPAYSGGITSGEEVSAKPATPENPELDGLEDESPASKEDGEEESNSEEKNPFPEKSEDDEESAEDNADEDEESNQDQK